ncbi:MAG: serine hydrolase [Alteraurantiacibacter sp.]
MIRTGMIRTGMSSIALLAIAAPAHAQDESWRQFDVADACRGLAPLDDAPVGEELLYRDPSPAVISMRRQLQNPEVNSFTFREVDEVFANRPVPAADTPRAWPTAQGFTMPEGYENFAYQTHTDALLVARDEQILFEDYRNRFDPEDRHIGFSMSKTITAMLVGQALARGEIASLDDMATQYWPALESGGYDGVTMQPAGNAIRRGHRGAL